MLKNDLLAYVPGRCQKYKSREDCLGRGSHAAGVKCVWNSKKENCERHPTGRPQSGGVESCLADSGSRNRTRSVCLGHSPTLFAVPISNTLPPSSHSQALFVAEIVQQLRRHHV